RPRLSSLPSTSALYTPPLHDALPILAGQRSRFSRAVRFFQILGSRPLVIIDEPDSENIGDRNAQRADPNGTDIKSGQGGSEQNRDRKSTRLNSSHVKISYAVFCLKKK